MFVLGSSTSGWLVSLRESHIRAAKGSVWEHRSDWRQIRMLDPPRGIIEPIVCDVVGEAEVECCACQAWRKVIGDPPPLNQFRAGSDTVAS